MKGAPVFASFIYLDPIENSIGLQTFAALKYDVEGKHC
jgi:hypothetical protein